MEGEDGSKLSKVSVRDERIPELGDTSSPADTVRKASSVTWRPRRTCPFTEQGVVPDLVLNPHALPRA